MRKPDGLSALTPHLFYTSTTEAIDWYVRAFGARERMRLESPDGKMQHAQIQIGEAVIMMGDAGEYIHPPDPERGAPGSLYLYTHDADAFFQRAVEAGAKPLIPVTSTFWGDRCGTLRDPFGYMWTIATCVEAMSPEEMVVAGRRAAAETAA